MQISKAGFLGALGSIVLAVAVAGVAHAQSATAPIAAIPVEIISVSPVPMLVVVPESDASLATIPESKSAVPLLPDPVALMARIDQMMAAEAADLSTLPDDATVQQALSRMPRVNGPVSAVIVTSFADGDRTCTRRIVYRAGGGAATKQVSSSGNACRVSGPAVPDASTPVSLPDVPATISPGAPRTYGPVKPASRMVVADLSD